MSYDARGRRITKTVANTGQWDCTYHYYLDRDSVVEEQNGSAQTIKQFVWGKQYIDELIQTSLNSSPTSQSTCDMPYWACQDANWNVLGIVNSSGVLTERYEYSAYGQRTSYFSAGTNDPDCMSPTMASQRFIASGSVTEPYGLCEVGHQGLIHDEECGLVYDRGRIFNPPLGCFNQREPFGSRYVDGLNLYQYELSQPTIGLDPYGLFDVDGPGDGYWWFIYGDGQGAYLDSNLLSQLQQSSGFQQYLSGAESQALADATSDYNCQDFTRQYKQNGWTTTPSGASGWQFNLLGHHVEYDWNITVNVTGTKKCNGCCDADVDMNWNVTARKWYTFTGKGYYGWGILSGTGTSYWLGGQMSGEYKTHIHKCN